MIMMGYLNMRLGEPSEKSEEELSTVLLDRGLVNMKDHFLPWRQYQGAGIWTWCMKQ